MFKFLLQNYWENYCIKHQYKITELIGMYWEL